MHRRGGVGSQLLCVGRHAATANIRPQPIVPGHQHSEHVGHRRPGDKQSACCRRKVEEGAHPAANLVLNFERNLVAAANIGVQAGGQHLRHHAYRSSSALYPAQKTRVGIARRER
jgi:hypothetical protein